MKNVQAMARADATVVGRVGTLEFLRPSRLKVDLRYQRRLNAERVNDLVADWDDNAAGILLVSRRSEGDYLIDGQHRNEAAILMGRGEDGIPCYVQAGLTLQEEADAFWRMNKARLTPSSTDTFRSRLVAGEPVAVGLRDTLYKHWVELRDFPSALAPNQVYAIGMVEAIYRAGDLDWVLAVIREGWPEHPAALRQERLAGFWRFYQAWRRYFADTKEGDARRAHLIGRMKEYGPNHFADKALEFVTALHSRKATAYARAIHLVYNSHLKTSPVRLPDWPPGELRHARSVARQERLEGIETRTAALSSLVTRQRDGQTAISGRSVVTNRMAGDNIVGMPAKRLDHRRTVQPVVVAGSKGETS